ncbi:hypothetical protein DA2_3088 [Desulfovibrio sp. A2]|nr:hypothetical protein DA2_3088 [Desulfovibrio sp. A2]
MQVYETDGHVCSGCLKPRVRHATRLALRRGTECGVRDDATFRPGGCQQSRPPSRTGEDGRERAAGRTEPAASRARPA